MLDVRYHKSNPTDYVLHYNRGHLKHEGTGLAFFYFVPTSTIAVVPLASANLPFVFNEPTSDFQTLTVQGQMTYRIAEPKKAAEMLDFTLDKSKAGRKEDDVQLSEVLLYVLQTLVRSEVQRLPIREAVFQGDQLSTTVMAQLQCSPEVGRMGVEILSLAILSIKPTPEMSKALEAETREALNRTADEAVYTRRNAAIEQERRIKENELQTDLLVQSRERELHERKLEGEIALEKQRAALTDERTENERKEADAKAYALKAMIAPVQGLDWHVLMMLQSHGADPASSIAMAFQELATNASKIGELNVSPELLRSLVGNNGKRN